MAHYYTITGLSDEFGISKRTLTHFVDSGLLIPKINPGGQGLARWFDEGSFQTVSLLKALYDLGLGVPTIKTALSQFIDKGKPGIFNFSVGNATVTVKTEKRL